MATKLVSRIEHAFQVTLQVSTVFEEPTLVAQALRIEESIYADGGVEELLDDLEGLTEEEAARLLEQEGTAEHGDSDN